MITTSIKEQKQEIYDTQVMIKKRIASIDILRGIVMLLMLVDHVRERFFYHQNVSDPINLNETSSELFFTRMTAHLCAPVFILLTGLSAWLYAHPSNKQPRSPSMFLFKRGLFLIVIECTLINLSWFGNYDALYLQVMWAIGVSMIVLSVMVRMNYWVIGSLGLLIIFGHNALEPISFATNEIGYTLWTILHDRGYIIESELINVKASYPVLPWIGVILLGYFAGPLYAHSTPSNIRKKQLLLSSFSAIAILIILRGFNLYGEAIPWEYSNNLIESVKSFVNFTKYPPSLDYILLTLGVAGIILFLLDNINNKASKVIERFGSAPLFFYILHLYVLLASYKVMVAIYGTNQGDYFGVDTVAQVWLIALVLACLLYFPTKVFSTFKKNSSNKWLKYL